MLTVAPNGTIGLSDVRQKKEGGKPTLHHQSEVVICKCGKPVKHCKLSGRLNQQSPDFCRGPRLFRRFPRKNDESLAADEIILYLYLYSLFFYFHNSLHLCN